MLFIHGGTWRVGDRRSTMFSGRHEALAAQHERVVLSVGYRRTRMPLWIFFGLCASPARPVPPLPASPAETITPALGAADPAVLFLGFALVSSPIVALLMALEVLPPKPLLAPLPALGLTLLYYVFWGAYPPGSCGPTPLPPILSDPFRCGSV